VIITVALVIAVHVDTSLVELI